MLPETTVKINKLKKKFTNRKISQGIMLFVLLVISWLVSLLFHFGVKDQDWYSFYYVGRGVATGQDMYKDFSDNKGPVWYILMAGLYKIFGNNPGEALVVSSAVLDTAAVWLLLSLVSGWFGEGRWGGFKKYTWAILVLLFYKSLSMGTLIGGMYAENLANIFLFAAFLLFDRRRDEWSGWLLAMAVFTRPTYLVFGAVFPALRWSGEIKSPGLYKWGAGFLAGILMVILPSLYFGSFKDLIGNLIIFNIKYGGAYSLTARFLRIMAVLKLDLRLIVCLAITLLGWFWIIKKEDRKTKLWVSVLAGGSFLATFGSGVFYTHHFLQFVPAATGVTYYLIRQEKIKMIFKPLLVSLGLLTICTFPLFLLTAKMVVYPNNIRPAPQIPETATHKYLEVVPFYPSLYFSYNKNSPDRYYQGFMLSKKYNPNPEADMARHAALDKNIVRETTFLVVRPSGLTDGVDDEYLRNFKGRFGLVLVRTVSFTGGKIDVYLSSN